MDSAIINLLHDVLGNYEQKSKGNLAFYCPFCKHYKMKLEVHPQLQYWNCWVCGTKGRSIFTLFKRMNADKAFFVRLNIISPQTKQFNIGPITDEKHEEIVLPEEYIPLWKETPKKLYYKHAIKFLKGRGITKLDILKYRLGYCDGGIYDGMIIMPNYNKQGQLTYFTNRSFLVSKSRKFINPPINRDVIGFELQLNWDEPITICESGLDAIVIKNNATPLYGKFLNKSLKLAILEYEVKNVNICLDPDATKNAMEHSQYFISNGIDVNFVKMPVGHDPSSLGHKKTWELINKAKPLSSMDIFESKVKSKL